MYMIMIARYLSVDCNVLSCNDLDMRINDNMGVVMGKKKKQDQTYVDFLGNFQTDKELQKMVFEALLDHVRQGFSIDSFKHLSEEDTRAALEKGLFCLKALEQALREGKGYWEGLGRAQSNGTCIGNSKSWYYNMSNRYGWRDRFDVTAEHKGNIEVSIVNYASKH